MPPSDSSNPYAPPRSSPDPDRYRHPLVGTDPTRMKLRAVSLVAFSALSGYLIYLGFNGWEYGGVPMQYVGALVAVGVVLGLLGVNIWRNGMIDPRNDPVPAEVDRKFGGKAR